jgi:hypothetical protein
VSLSPRGALLTPRIFPMAATHVHTAQMLQGTRRAYVAPRHPSRVSLGNYWRRKPCRARAPGSPRLGTAPVPNCGFLCGQIGLESITNVNDFPENARAHHKLPEWRRCKVQRIANKDS